MQKKQINILIAAELFLTTGRFKNTRNVFYPFHFIWLDSVGTHPQYLQSPIRLESTRNDCVGEYATHHSIIPISGYTSVLSQPLTLEVYKEIKKKKQYDLKRSENQNRLDNLVYCNKK